MTGEIDYFRKQFFGGFNQQDVIDYIAKLARERNDIAEARENAANEIQKMAGEIAALRFEIDEAKRTENDFKQNMEATVALAVRFFRELETAFNSVFSGIEAVALKARDELEAAADTVARLPSVLVSAVEQYGELRKAFEAVDEAGAADGGCAIDEAGAADVANTADPIFGVQESEVIAETGSEHCVADATWADGVAEVDVGAEGGDEGIWGGEHPEHPEYPEYPEYTERPAGDLADAGDAAEPE